MILDLDYSLQRQTNRDMLIEQVNDSTLRGRKRTAYWAPTSLCASIWSFRVPSPSGW